VSELTETTQATEVAQPETGGAAPGRWIGVIPAPLRIVLTLGAATVGLWVSEHTLLYAPLGFPDEVGHSPANLLAQPGLMLLVAAALSAWIMLRRSPGVGWRPALERLLHGLLLLILAYTCVLAPAQANQAATAIRAGRPFFSPPLAPLPVNVALADVEWRADVPTSARVGYGRVLYVRWVAHGAVVWFWDADQHAAVGVPAIQISVVRTHPPGAELARPNQATITTSFP
jgi:hypothetical protein